MRWRDPRRHGNAMRSWPQQAFVDRVHAFGKLLGAALVAIGIERPVGGIADQPRHALRKTGMQQLVRADRPRMSAAPIRRQISNRAGLISHGARDVDLELRRQIARQHHDVAGLGEPRHATRGDGTRPAELRRERALVRHHAFIVDVRDQYPMHRPHPLSLRPPRTTASAAATSVQLCTEVPPARHRSPMIKRLSGGDATEIYG